MSVKEIKWNIDSTDALVDLENAIRKWANNTSITSNIYEEEISFKSAANNNSLIHFNKNCIKDVKIYNDKVVEVTFSSGDKQKTVCDDCQFDIIISIMVCVMKELYGKSVYSIISKRYDEIEKEKAAKKDEQERLEALKERRIEKKKRRAEKRKQKAIEIQKQAYIEAMKEINKN